MLIKDLKIILKKQRNLTALKPPKDDLGIKDIDLRDKIVSKPNMSDFDIDDLDIEDIEKDDRLEKYIEEMEKNTSGKTKLFDKFAEIDKKSELDEPQEPTKNRSSKKNR